MDYEPLLLAAGFISFIIFTGTAFAVPFLINRIPEDYFLRENRKRRIDNPWGKGLYFIFKILKNIAGIMLFLIGFVLLFMPGQGLLTLFMGLVLLDFPGKWKIEKKFIKTRTVAAAVNWIRRKNGKKEILIPE